jgi:hypothetical protein
MLQSRQDPFVQVEANAHPVLVGQRRRRFGSRFHETEASDGHVLSHPGGQGMSWILPEAMPASTVV